MVTAFYAIAFVLVLGGAGVLVRGAPFIGVDWGNTLVLAGTVAACSGALLAGVAAAVARLTAIENELAAARERTASHAASPQLIPEAAGLRPNQLSAEPAFPHQDPPGAPEVHDFPSLRAATTAPISSPDRAALEEASFPPPPGEPFPQALAAPQPGRLARAIPGFLTRPRAPTPAHDPQLEPDAPDLPRAGPTSPPVSQVETQPEPSSRRPRAPWRERGPVAPSEAAEQGRPELAADQPAGPEEAAAHEPLSDRDGTAPGEGATVESVSAADSALPATDMEGPENGADDAAPAHEIGRYSSGGNSYVMFSDGSIEAETPNGKFRFASLDELKQFIASGGERSASATG